MQLTYEKKRGLIGHLSARAHWKNVFDEDFFTTPWRKGNSRNVGIFHRFVNDRGNRVSIEHPTGSTIKFELLGDKICIGDETGRQMVLEAGQLKSNELVLEDVTAAALDEKTVDVPGTRICVRFRDNGDRTVIFGDLDKQIKIPFDSTQAVATPLSKGAQIHVATITERQARAFGLDPDELLDATKMVIAFDLGIEPTLRAMNVAQGYILYPSAPVDGLPQAWRRKLYTVGELVQKPWLDTTEFEGYDVPPPKNFYVEKDDGGINVITTLDQREAIWSQGDVLGHVSKSDTSPVRTVKANMTSRQLLRLLGDGPSASDRRGREWKYVLVHSPEARTLSPKVRGAVSERFGLTARHCAVLTMDKDVCLVAMNVHVLDAALSGTTMVNTVTEKLIEEGVVSPSAKKPQSPSAGGTVVPLSRPGKPRVS